MNTEEMSIKDDISFQKLIDFFGHSRDIKIKGMVEVIL